MRRYEATFEVESKAEADAVRRLTERLHDVLREETRTHDHGTATVETVEAFAALRDAARQSKPGVLTVRYVQDEGSFED
jgi:hypothetical protein